MERDASGGGMMACPARGLEANVGLPGQRATSKVTSPEAKPLAGGVWGGSRFPKRFPAVSDVRDSRGAWSIFVRHHYRDGGLWVVNV